MPVASLGSLHYTDTTRLVTSLSSSRDHLNMWRWPRQLISSCQARDCMAASETSPRRLVPSWKIIPHEPASGACREEVGVWCENSEYNKFPPVPHLDLWVGLPTPKISLPLCVTYTPNLAVLCWTVSAWLKRIMSTWGLTPLKLSSWPKFILVSVDLHGSYFRIYYPEITPISPLYTWREISPYAHPRRSSSPPPPVPSNFFSITVGTDVKFIRYWMSQW